MGCLGWFQEWCLIDNVLSKLLKSSHRSSMECLSGEGENDKTLLSNYISSLVNFKSVKLITVWPICCSNCLDLFVCNIPFGNVKEFSLISVRLGSIFIVLYGYIGPLICTIRDYIERPYEYD